MPPQNVGSRISPRQAKDDPLGDGIDGIGEEPEQDAQENKQNGGSIADNDVLPVSAIGVDVPLVDVVDDIGGTAVDRGIERGHESCKESCKQQARQPDGDEVVDDIGQDQLKVDIPAHGVELRTEKDHRQYGHGRDHDPPGHNRHGNDAVHQAGLLG